ncbi:kelch-like ECH-associated protein 1 isoform X3 [Ornithodoros turicata]|uniref:kelch-like ECH-associated protein 1 isoform X3 n=1 Tax=Ornithodoros turicata TaxID=34597 RepID=UPI003138ED7D
MEHKDIRTAQTTGATSSCFRIGCSVGAHNESPSIEDYEPQTYTKEAFEVFEVLWLQRKLCDVEIEIAGEGSIKAHRIVLAALSPYFRAMFTSDLKESQMEKIPIHGVGFHTMGKIIKFAYTGRIKVEESNVCQLLPAANMLQVQHVSHACCRFLEHQLEPSNCIGIADFALQHGMMGLYSLASCFIEQHFPSVSRLEEFLSLPYGRLVTLLRKDELYVRCESEVFDAVVRWALHDEENRRMHLEPVLQAVRCHFLAPHFLQEQLRSCAIVRSHQRCCDYLSKVVQDLTVHRKYSCCHERCPSVPCVLYVAGGYLQRSLGAAECYSAATESWTVLPDLPIGRSGLASAFLAGRFYVAGGRVLRPPRELGDDTSAVHCYDPAQNEWIECKPMGVPRHRLAMGVLDGRLYAVAGSHGKDCLRSAERKVCRRRGHNGKQVDRTSAPITRYVPTSPRERCQWISSLPLTTSGGMTIFGPLTQHVGTVCDVFFSGPQITLDVSDFRACSVLHLHVQPLKGMDHAFNSGFLSSKFPFRRGRCPETAVCYWRLQWVLQVEHRRVLQPRDGLLVNAYSYEDRKKRRWSRVAWQPHLCHWRLRWTRASEHR